MSVVETRTVGTGDRREICVEAMTNVSGVPCFMHNGSPNSRHLWASAAEDAAQRGIRLISYDRPGYGGSTAQPGRTVADCAADVADVADAFGLSRFLVWGISGGGPHALATAALLPDRVAAAATIGSPAPYGPADFDYFSGMGELNVEDVRLYLNDRAAAREKCKSERVELLEVMPDELLESWRTLLSPVDAAALSAGLAAQIVDGFQDGLAPGDQGWWDDGVATMEPWGFDVDAIRVPVSIWHGSHDLFVPIQHGEWLAAHVAGADARLSETDGHLSFLVNRIGEIHQWLLDHWNG